MNIITSDLKIVATDFEKQQVIPTTSSPHVSASECLCACTLGTVCVHWCVCARSQTRECSLHQFTSLLVTSLSGAVYVAAHANS